MQHWRVSRLLLGIVALSVLAGISVRGVQPDAAHAGSGQTWEVLVGTDIEAEFLSTQRYFPNPVTINAGDTVRFSWRGFHTVTFPGGQPLPPFEIPGTAAGTLILNPQLFFASLPPGQTSTTYNGSGFLNLIPADEGGEGDEDVPPPSFDVTFTRPGTYEYFCAIHPGMRGDVSVVAGAALPETPAQAQVRGRAELQLTLAAMRGAVARATSAQPATAQAAGRSTTHAALVGLGSGFSASYLNFLPGRLTVRRGDIVVWTMPDPYEIHTVTYTAGAEAPSFVEPQFGPGGPMAGPPTLVIPANVVGRVGGDTFTCASYTNSGILGDGQSYTLRIDAPTGTYQFLCVVHPFMTVDLTVTEP